MEVMDAQIHERHPLSGPRPLGDVKNRQLTLANGILVPIWEGIEYEYDE
jgi:hypothetical protein